MTHASPQELRQILPNRRILILQNPGRGSRNCLDGIIAGLRRLNLNVCVLELHEVWAIQKSDPTALVQRMSQILVQQKIGAALSYGFNGLADFPIDPIGHAALARMRSFLEIRSIPHIMWWLDHPQWHADQAAFLPETQAMFRSANNIHFLKSTAHALEIEGTLGWPNCFGLPVAIHPDQFPPIEQNQNPEFDLVAIHGEGGDLPSWLADFAALDAPDPAAIRAVIMQSVLQSLSDLWKADTPEALHADLTALGKKWAALKSADPFLAAARHWPVLTAEFPGAAWFLTLAYPVYMKAARILWRFREWERRFYLAYLAKYFRLGVFGGNFSKMNLGPGGWVDYAHQSQTYARGKVALSIIDGHDEEGLTLKPFEIAASGIPMLHYHAEGITDCFEPATEIETFRTPKEAKEKLTALLTDPSRRQSMAAAARTRVLQNHTWETRLKKIFELARLPMDSFLATK